MAPVSDHVIGPCCVVRLTCVGQEIGELLRICAFVGAQATIGLSHYAGLLEARYKRPANSGYRTRCSVECSIRPRLVVSTTQQWCSPSRSRKRLSSGTWRLWDAKLFLWTPMLDGTVERVFVCLCAWTCVRMPIYIAPNETCCTSPHGSNSHRMKSGLHR